jgi:hypothetical protein
MRRGIFGPEREEETRNRENYTEPNIIRRWSQGVDRMGTYEVLTKLESHKPEVKRPVVGTGRR